VDGASFVDADIGGESLQRGVARANDVPLARWISRERILTDDGIRARLRERMGSEEECDAGGDHHAESTDESEKGAAPGTIRCHSRFSPSRDVKKNARNRKDFVRFLTRRSRRVERFVRCANDYRSKSIATVLRQIDVKRSSVRVVHKRSHGSKTPLE
jgi:hypothetical protein